MKKTAVLIFYFSFFLLPISFINAQSWSPIGKGIQGNGGGGGIVKYNGNLWIGGAFDSAGGLPSRNIAQWNNSIWIPMPNGFDRATSAGIIYNGDLYIGGEYDSVDGKPISLLARWSGSKWDSVGVLGLAGNAIFSLDTFKGKLYADGWFGAADGFLVNGIACWDGTKWDSLDNGVGTPRYGQPICMSVYKGVLYVGGVFDTVDRKRAWNFAGWDGSNWITYDTIVNDIIYAMVVYKGELYIGGYFDRAGGVPVHSIARWNGTTWNDVGGGIEFNSGTGNYRVEGLCVYNGDLYVGGHFDTAGGAGVHNIAKWNGTAWSDVDMGVRGGGFPVIYSLMVYDSSMYIGGVFDTAGSLPCSNIARWTTLSGIQEISDNSNCKIYPNPNTGTFTIALLNNDKCTLEIYNVFGESIYKATLNSSNTEINLNGQSTGVYFYRVITDAGNLLGEGKLIIKK